MGIIAIACIIPIILIGTFAAVYFRKGRNLLPILVAFALMVVTVCVFIIVYSADTQSPILYVIAFLNVFLPIAAFALFEKLCAKSSRGHAAANTDTASITGSDTLQVQDTAKKQSVQTPIPIRISTFIEEENLFAFEPNAVQNKEDAVEETVCDSSDNSIFEDLDIEDAAVGAFPVEEQDVIYGDAPLSYQPTTDPSETLPTSNISTEVHDTGGFGLSMAPSSVQSSASEIEAHVSASPEPDISSAVAASIVVPLDAPGATGEIEEPEIPEDYYVFTNSIEEPYVDFISPLPQPAEEIPAGSSTDYLAPSSGTVDITNDNSLSASIPDEDTIIVPSEPHYEASEPYVTDMPVFDEFSIEEPTVIFEQDDTLDSAVQKPQLLVPTQEQRHPQEERIEVTEPAVDHELSEGLDTADSSIIASPSADVTSCTSEKQAEDNMDTGLMEENAIDTGSPSENASTDVISPRSSKASDSNALAKKAKSFSEKGMFVVAARLYREAADCATDSNYARSLRFSELSCFVKTGDSAKIRELVEELKRSPVLSKSERMKIQAAERIK